MAVLKSDAWLTLIRPRPRSVSSSVISSRSSGSSSITRISVVAVMVSAPPRHGGHGRSARARGSVARSGAPVPRVRAPSVTRNSRLFCMRSSRGRTGARMAPRDSEDGGARGMPVPTAGRANDPVTVRQLLAGTRDPGRQCRGELDGSAGSAISGETVCAPSLWLRLHKTVRRHAAILGATAGVRGWGSRGRPRESLRSSGRCRSGCSRRGSGRCRAPRRSADRRRPGPAGRSRRSAAGPVRG